jgi:predicted naringenin-chalcone synthase
MSPSKVTADSPASPSTSARGRKSLTLADLAQAYVDDRTEGLSPLGGSGEDHVKKWLCHPGGPSDIDPLPRAVRRPGRSA